jgi:hypothetical protein
VNKSSPKRDAVIRALLASPGTSTTLIARQVGCAASYAMAVVKDLKSNNRLLLAQPFVGANGRTYQRRCGIAKTTAAVAARLAQVRTMAADGHNTAQIAAALEMSKQYVGQLLQREGLARRGVGAKTRTHNAARIVEHTVMDAEGLTKDVKLIDFATLPIARIPDWIASLEQARLDLGTFIRQLRSLAYEVTQRGEADRPETSNAPPLESPPGAIKDDAGASGGFDPTGVS